MDRNQYNVLGGWGIIDGTLMSSLEDVQDVWDNDKNSTQVGGLIDDLTITKQAALEAADNHELMVSLTKSILESVQK